MNLLPRHAIAGAAAALFATLALPAFAQAPVSNPSTPDPQVRYEPRPERMERMQKRMGEFKQALQLNPAQEDAWNQYQQAMKPPTQPPARPDVEAFKQLSTPERIERLRALREQHAAEMDRRGEATKAFYAQLNPAQQKTFDAHSLRWMQRMHDHDHGPRHGAMRGSKPPVSAPAQQ
ncbi:MAG: Spy/CpxP family protein refolding chaperone [Comamonadaceae bacterium]|jgi:hypothetical protein|nr:Spy/CpxP family protein refolding chaperone [Comamonadaceae bacterium]